MTEVRCIICERPKTKGHQCEGINPDSGLYDAEIDQLIVERQANPLIKFFRFFFECKSGESALRKGLAAAILLTVSIIIFQDAVIAHIGLLPLAFAFLFFCGFMKYFVGIWRNKK